MENPRVRVAAIIVQGDSILLVRHVRDGRTYWLLPGGGVDYGETMEEALVREMKEEGNLDVRVKDLVIANDSIPPDKHRHVINLHFTAEIVGGELRLDTNDPRLAEMKFVPISELLGLTFFPDIRPALISAIQAGFPCAASYMGNLWK